MSQYPPPPDFAPIYQPPMYPSKISAAAITSLVLGILGCVPFLTGLLAIIFGIVGIQTTSNPAVRGRGMAIAGLVLGLISIIGWAGFGSLIAIGVHAAAPARTQSRLFLQELSSGDVNTAMKLCAPNVSRASVQQASDAMQAWGPYQDATFVSFNVNNTNSLVTSNVAGSVRFQNGNKSASFTFTKSPDGTLKLQEWHIQ
jgi:Domain of unknown function (DUF4190)